MKRFLARRRLLRVTIAVLALVGATAILWGPRIVRAISLITFNVINFDAVSVPVDHTLHVHLVNQLGTGPMTFRAILRPTTPGAGASAVGAVITLNPGQGSDEAFPFAGFSPPAGATRVPVTCTILVGSAAGTLPADWSGRVASSVEIVEDHTGRQTAILGGRHIVNASPGGVATPCLFCN